MDKFNGILQPLKVYCTKHFVSCSHTTDELRQHLAAGMFGAGNFYGWRIQLGLSTIQ